MELGESGLRGWVSGQLTGWGQTPGLLGGWVQDLLGVRGEETSGGLGRFEQGL